MTTTTQRCWIATATLAVLVLAVAVWQAAGRHQADPRGSRPERDPAAASAGDDGRGGDLATGGAAPRREAAAARLRLVVGGQPAPGGRVVVVESGSRRRLELQLGPGGLVGGDVAPGDATLSSGDDPPAFAERPVVLEPGLNEVEVRPLARLTLRFVDLAGRAVAPHAYECDVRSVLASDVEACVAGRDNSGDAVRTRLEQRRGARLVDGQTVASDRALCVLAGGRDVLRVAPPHVAWFGGSRSGGGGLPAVGGLRIPVTAPLEAPAGGDVEVTVVLARSGAIEVSLAGWPRQDETVITLRRGGRHGVDSAGNSWKIAAERMLRPGVDPVARRDPVVFAGLLPGLYKIDAYGLHGRVVTCALLLAEVRERHTSSLELRAGVGRHRLTVASGTGVPAELLILYGSVPPPEWLEPDAPRPFHTLTVALEEQGEGDVVFDGLSATAGTVTRSGPAGHAMATFDLSRSARCLLR